MIEFSYKSEAPVFIGLLVLGRGVPCLGVELRL